jgi:hypothetical protein
MMDDLDRILAEDPTPPPPTQFTSNVMRAVRTAAEPPPRVKPWAPVSSPALVFVGLALAVYGDPALLLPAAAAMIALAVWQARAAALEFEY